MRDLIDIYEPGRHAEMKKSRLHRRIYNVNGPNHIWHIDGNDKLKPFGFCISGAIDGWSHLLLWLKVDVTNKNPNLICRYYLDTVTTLDTVPRIVRVDPGTENVHIMDTQSLLRAEHHDNLANKPVFVGSSNHNQRIEKFWGYLRPAFLQDYMDLFSDLVMAGIHDTSNLLHIECLKFCFMQVIRRELAEVQEHWNLHRMRKIKRQATPCGIPDFLYNNPEAFGKADQGLPVNMDILTHCKTIYNKCDNELGCEEIFGLWALEIMSQNGWTFPHTSLEALELYGHLLIEIMQA